MPLSLIRGVIAFWGDINRRRFVESGTSSDKWEVTLFGPSFEGRASDMDRGTGVLVRKEDSDSGDGFVSADVSRPLG